VVIPSLPVKNIKELIAYLKAHPGKVNYGAASPSSASTLEMLAFLRSTGTEAVMVPYKGGAGPAVIGLLANEVQMTMLTFSSLVSFVKQGRLRMVAVVQPGRNPALPDVPTMREQGINQTVGSWQGLFVPKGTPKSVVDRLYKVGVETMKDPQVVKRLGDLGVSIVTSQSPAEFAAFVKSETARFGKVIKEENIQTQ